MVFVHPFFQDHTPYLTKSLVEQLTALDAIDAPYSSLYASESSSMPPRQTHHWPHYSGPHSSGTPSRSSSASMTRSSVSSASTSSSDSSNSSSSKSVTSPSTSHATTADKPKDTCAMEQWIRQTRSACPQFGSVSPRASRRNPEERVRLFEQYSETAGVVEVEVRDGEEGDKGKKEKKGKKSGKVARFSRV